MHLCGILRGPRVLVLCMWILSLAVAIAIGQPVTKTASASKHSDRSKAQDKSSSVSRKKTGARTSKEAATKQGKPCEAVSTRQRRGTKAAKTAMASPCHPPGYVDPAIKRNLRAALSDLNKSGIKPTITSTWRSSGDQRWLFNCTSSKRCRSLHPGLYKALPPGTSLHEAGFAVDITGVAQGPNGRKHFTAQGRKIVRIMSRHGFNWKYGMSDPVHFEANPKAHGYHNLKQAIRTNQTRCDAGTAVKQAVKKGRPSRAPERIAKAPEESSSSRGER